MNKNETLKSQSPILKRDGFRIQYVYKGNKTTCLLYTQKYGLTPSYVGRSKCSPEDEFNFETGEKLSFLRAKQKYLNDLYKFTKRTWLFHKNRAYEEEKTLISISGNLGDVARELFEIKEHEALRFEPKKAMHDAFFSLL